MSKTKLIQYVAEAQDGLSKKQVEEVINATFEAVGRILVEDGEATLPGVGKLKLKERPARTGRNPKTGETVKIAAKTAVKFSAAKALNDAINS